jgi:ribonucleoside-diphosphate reductase alpha chain
MYRWLNAFSQQFLERDYLLPGQVVDARVNIVCDTAEKILGIDGFAADFKECIQKGWVSLSTPIWTNFGTERGMPISCFGSCIEDSMSSILFTHAEVGAMSKLGGGTSAYFGKLRPRGAPIRDNGESYGAVHFMRLFDHLIGIVSQGNTRRGNFAAYLPMDHKDINEFLTIRTEGSLLQDIFYGVCVSDLWMESMIAGDADKRKLWARVIEARANTGLPYILFTDNANKGAVDVYRDKGMEITHSNLCSEIMLPDGEHESFVCDLSSMNILYYDEWKNTNAVELLTFFLDAVMTEFIDKARKIPFMERAVNFAQRHRALGIGWIGYHSFLQSRMVPFESWEAKRLNIEIAKHIKAESWDASRALAKIYGEPEVLKGYGRRNTTLTAIAPTKSSAFIMGQISEGIEPHRSNYFVKDLQKGKFTVRNHVLEDVLEAHGKNTDAVWEDIQRAAGSVQHLAFLSENEKAVFKTFSEISPSEVVIQASARQKYIDQSQSLNLFIDPRVPAKDVNALLISAWKSGVKSLYYQINENAAHQLARSILSCSACEA